MSVDSISNQSCLIQQMQQEVSLNSSQQSDSSSKVSAVLMKRSPLAPRFVTANALTSNQISATSYLILNGPQNGGGAIEAFLKTPRGQSGKTIEEKTVNFEAAAKEDVENNYFSPDQWTLKDLHNKDNLLLCLSATQLNNPNHNRLRAPKFLGNVFSECNCRGTSNRNNTDRIIINRIEKQFPDKEKTIKYVSFGSDGCFPDWVILSNLVLLGYKNVEIHLTGAFEEPAKKMKEFFESYPEVKFSVTAHKTFREFTEKSPGPADIVLALDFNGDNDKQNPPAKVVVSDQGFALCAATSRMAPNWDLVDTKGIKLAGQMRNMQVTWPKLG